MAIALYTSFTTPPVSQDGQWLHQSLWHSIQIIFWGFVISSAIGVPLGILAGSWRVVESAGAPLALFGRGQFGAYMGRLALPQGIVSAAAPPQPDLGRAIDQLIEAVPPGGSGHLLCTYTAMLDLRALLVRRGWLRPYWAT